MNIKDLPENKYDVAVVGNVGIDTNIYFGDREIDFSVESVFTENIDYVGQAGGYSSRGFAQLGKKTVFIGYIGDDYLGRFIREEFKKDGINTDAVFIDPAGTSRSINFMYKDGRRKNFYDGKSHMTLTPDLDICENIISKSRLIHFNIPNWARFLLPLAKKHNKLVSCDLQDVVSLSDPYRRDFIQAADFLFFSAVNHHSPKEMIEHFLEKYPEKIIISGMGNQGCMAGKNNEIIFQNALELDEPVIDTNGAGDSLAVGFLTSYVFDGYNVTDSCMRGQITARHTCTQKADSSNLIKLNKLNHLFNRFC